MSQQWQMRLGSEPRGKYTKHMHGRTWRPKNSWRRVMAVSVLLFVVGSVIWSRTSNDSAKGGLEIQKRFGALDSSKGFQKRQIPQPSQVYTSPEIIPNEVLENLDLIMVLGGGVPSAYDSPPVYVQRRCDDAASVVQRFAEIKSHQDPVRTLPVLCLSAGTAHMPQLSNPATGLPVWESTASAAYLLRRHPDLRVYVETTSYDTIGNAFFARTSHTDRNPDWRNLLVITNEFHMARSKAIFDWIFGLDEGGYRLWYLSSPDVGLSSEALAARNEKERSSLKSVENHLAPKHQSLSQVWHFLAHDHSLYTAKDLVERGAEKGGFGGNGTKEASDLVKKSYGLL